MPRPVNDDELLRELDRRAAGYGNGKQLAAKLDINPQHLSSILSGSHPLPHHVAVKLGYELRWVKRKGVERE